MIKRRRTNSREEQFRAQVRRSRVALYSFVVPMLAASWFMGIIDSALRLLYILLGFSLIIFLHELGHFLVARWCSVKCLAFSIGIGPRMCGWRQHGRFSFGADPYDPDSKKKKHKAETATVQSDLPTTAHEPPHPKSVGDCDYRISWLPLGGYVRMLGQDDMDPSKISSDPNSFNRRPIWQRMCIVSAGVTMNIIFAIIVFSIIFSPSLGVDFPPAVVGQVHHDMPAWGKLQMGDEILEINDEPVTRGRLEFTDVMMKAALSSGSDEIKLKVKRVETGKIETVSILPRRSDLTGFLAFGIDPLPGNRINASQYTENAENSLRLIDPAYEANWKSLKDLTADKENKETFQIRKIDDVVLPVGVYPFPVFYQYVQTRGQQPVTLTLENVKDSSKTRTLVITPHLERRPGVDAYPSVFGLSPRVVFAEPDKKTPGAKAGIKGGDRVVRVGTATYPDADSIRRIISGTGGEPIEIQVERDVAPASTQAAATAATDPSNARTVITITATPTKSKDGKYRIGVPPLEDVLRPTFRPPEPETPLGALNLPASATIAAIDGVTVQNWQDIYREVRKKEAGKSINVSFSPGDGRAPITAALTLSAEEQSAVRDLLHYQTGLVLENQNFTQRAENFPQAAMMGFDHTKKFILQVYMTLAGLFRQTISPDNLHGIVGITKIGYDVQERGMIWLWYVLAMVSVNLAVANFLPLPIVDGGLFLLLILEKIRGKPLSLKVQSAIQVVGIVLLAGLFLFVTYNDIGLFTK